MASVFADLAILKSENDISRMKADQQKADYVMKERMARENAKLAQMKHEKSLDDRVSKFAQNMQKEYSKQNRYAPPQGLQVTDDAGSVPFLNVTEGYY